MGKSQDLYKLAKKIIPGGTQLLSKRPEMFLPEFWPAYYKKAKGCEVWDLDGKKYIDMCHMSVGACLLGYADDDINKAVIKTVRNGNMASLNAPEEVELAKVLLKIHPWAEMVRYARTGGEAMTIAVRIARAATKKDIILFCGYHGWQDWYLAANLSDKHALNGHLLAGLEPRGIPKGLTGTSFTFPFNQTQEFLSLVNKKKNKVAAVILEPIRYNQPRKEFLQTIRETTRKQGIVLIADEISAGWRFTWGGSHLLFDFKPDIAVFSKAMSNGFPMAAVIGRKNIMETSQDTFISSTYWTDRIGPVAALATIKKLKKLKVDKYISQIGKSIKLGWEKAALNHGLKINIFGTDALPHFTFVSKRPLILKTLFTQLMLQRGFLATTYFYSTYAHKPIHLKHYFKSVDESFTFISIAIKEGRPEKYLLGPVCHTGFQKLF